MVRNRRQPALFAHLTGAAQHGFITPAVLCLSKRATKPLPVRKLRSGRFRSTGGGTLRITELLDVLGEQHLDPHFELRRKS